MDDKRLVKMCLETTQLLCTAINLNGGLSPYKSTHKNHPASIWARETQGNWMWLWSHGISLCKEYTHRYNKYHKCEGILKEIVNQKKLLPTGDRTPFANCAAHAGKGISYKHIEDTVQAYRLYMADRWSTDIKHPTWTNTDAPHWIVYSQVAKRFLLAPEYELVESENEQV